jgi:predicted dehydrogenase
MHPITNVAIIGCGHWGPNHIRAFAELPQCRVVAAVDPDSAKLASLEEKFPHLRFENRYAALLADKRIEAAVVATPAGTHYEIVRDVLMAGKHVLCEKPLCQSAATARALVALAEERRLVLMTGHVFLFNAGLNALKDVLINDKLGHVRHLSAIRTNLGPIRNDVNAAYDLAAHDVAIFNWLLDGRPTQVSACGAAYLRPGIQDVVSLSLIYPDKVFATVYASWLSPVKARRICVIGERRMAAWEDGQSDMAVTIYDKGTAVLADNTGGEAAPRVSIWDGEIRKIKKQWLEPLKLQAEHFLWRLRHLDAAGPCDGKFALDVVETLEAVCHSMRAGGAPIPLAGGSSIDGGQLRGPSGRLCGC